MTTAPGAPDTGDRPDWFCGLVEACADIGPGDLSRIPVPATGGRESAVLILLGSGAAGPEVLLIERAHAMRSHAGQPAFPGGGLDADDAGPVEAALRESVEETGLDPAGVEVATVLPRLWLPPTRWWVTPVLAWWRRPTPVAVVDPDEVASVHLVPLRSLADPANRLRLLHPSGHVGPAFRVSGLLVWGFTAGLLDRVVALGGWELPWDSTGEAQGLSQADPRDEDLPA